MTSEDAKRMSLTIGSQESLESLGGVGKPRPMFIKRETIIKEGTETEQTTAPVSATNNNNTGNLHDSLKYPLLHVQCPKFFYLQVRFKNILF